MMRKLTTLLTIMLIAPLVSGEGEPIEGSVTAIDVIAGVEVSWLPGTVPAESYRIFGLNGSNAVLLHETNEGDPTTVLVERGYAAYGVAGVRNDVQTKVYLAAYFPLPKCYSIVEDDTKPMGHEIKVYPLCVLDIV